MRSRLRDWAAVSMAALALLVPLVAGAWVAVLALAESPLESSTAQEPLYGFVESAERFDAEVVTVSLAKPEEFAVQSQSSGIITRIYLVAGESIEAGATVMEVDGRSVTAYRSCSPLYRNIHIGLSGSDVRTAQRLLVELGYLDVADGKAGPNTSRAIQEFNADRGRADEAAVLSLASLLWVPCGVDSPDALLVRVGTVVAPDSDLFDASIGDELALVHGAEADTDRVLRVRGVEVVLPAGELEISDAAFVAALAASLEGNADSAAGDLTLAEPRIVGVVPSSAVIFDATGAACFVQDVDDSPVAIDALAGGFGLVDVDSSLVGTQVLLNPRDVLGEISCA